MEALGSEQIPLTKVTEAPAPASRTSLRSSKMSFKTATRTRPTLLKYFQDWSWELASWAFATLLTIVLVVLDVIYDDKPTADFHSLVQLTTIVAFGASIAQSALLVPVASCFGQLKWLAFRKPRPLLDMERFDDASRGPVGSLMILIARPGVLPSLASFITVIMLAFAAFTQQAITTNVQWSLLPTSGSISAVREYSSDNLAYGQTSTELIGADGNQYTAIVGTLAGPFKAAILEGLYANSIDPSSVQGMCPSSNCTWPRYTSLGFCASIEDISSTVTSTGEDCGQTLDQSDNCTMTTQFLQDYQVWAARDGALRAGYNMFIGAPEPVHWTPTDAATVGLFNIIYYSTFQFPNDGLNGFPPAVTTNDTIKAAQVNITLCQHTYQTEIVNSTTNTTLLETSPDLSPFTIDQGARMAIFKYLSYSIFYGSMRLSSYGSDAAQGLGNALYAQQNITDTSTQVYSTGTNDGRNDLQRRMDQLTMSMTNGLRTAAINGGQEDSNAYQQQQYYHVRFEWLILPLMLDLLTLILLICTMSLTHKREIPAWKLSQLALMSVLSSSAESPNEHDDAPSSVPILLGETKDMQERAKGYVAYLSEGDNAAYDASYKRSWSLKMVPGHWEVSNHSDRN